VFAKSQLFKEWKMRAYLFGYKPTKPYEFRWGEHGNPRVG
jgi:hypothetical protein